MNKDQKDQKDQQDEYNAERTANGDKRLINLLYQKIELQQEEIKDFTLAYEKRITELQNLESEIEALKKELALQRLSDIGQEIERELTDEEIKQIFTDKTGYEVDTCPSAILEFSRAILKKAKEK
jgi:cell shape-determining protein MreC